ncbi:unnamed protein product [Phytophthora fragariaefolia]|uniref:Unnamed protein product n=1 Tax=Phytophthora fragariaefolia TaxID=1490495 RepID=A0A9W6Y6P3_9STRA|nr:unnamed protein product [Phytophthora fragariaefolia]
MRLRLDDGLEGEAHGEVEVSSSVRVAEADNNDPEGGSSTEEDDDQGVNERGDGREHTSAPDARHGVNEDAHQFSVNKRNQHNDEDHSSQHSAHDDDLDSMTWWDALTAGQQRAMMKRFVSQAPTLATSPNP